MNENYVILTNKNRSFTIHDKSGRRAINITKLEIILGQNAFPDQIELAIKDHKEIIVHIKPLKEYYHTEEEYLINENLPFVNFLTIELIANHQVKEFEVKVFYQ